MDPYEHSSVIFFKNQNMFNDEILFENVVYSNSSKNKGLTP